MVSTDAKRPAQHITVAAAYRLVSGQTHWDHTEAQTVSGQAGVGLVS